MSQAAYISRIRPPFDARLLQSACCGKDFREEDTAAVFQDLAQAYRADSVFLFGSARQGLNCVFDAVGIGRNDAVILADFNCRSMLAPIVCCGVRPVFVDVSSSFTYNVDQMREALRSPGVKAIIVTHFFGQSCWTPRMKEFAEEAKQRGVYVIEDSAHSLADDAQPDIGRFGQAVLFSFGNDKPLSAGKGGMVLIRDPELTARVNQSYQRLCVRSLEEERGMLLWHILYSFLSRPESCPPGLPCVLPSYVSPSEDELSAIIQCVNENPTVDALTDFPSIRASLRLINGGTHSILDRSLRRLAKVIRSGRSTAGVPTVPTRMNSLTKRVLSAYLSGGALQEANTRRSENYRNILERVRDRNRSAHDHGEVGIGARLRYTHVYNSADEARRAVDKAKRVGVEAGCYNWSPLLSSLVGVRRAQPAWAVHPSRVVNYPVHQYLSDDDLTRVAGLIT